jgi:hypothetical protein
MGHLLDLPIEVRVVIYEEYLSGVQLERNDGTGWSFKRVDECKHPRGLLYVNRQIYDELRPKMPIFVQLMLHHTGHQMLREQIDSRTQSPSDVFLSRTHHLRLRGMCQILLSDLRWLSEHERPIPSILSSVKQVTLQHDLSTSRLLVLLAVKGGVFPRHKHAFYDQESVDHGFSLIVDSLDLGKGTSAIEGVLLEEAQRWERVLQGRDVLPYQINILSGICTLLGCHARAYGMLERCSNGSDQYLYVSGSFPQAVQILPSFYADFAFPFQTAVTVLKPGRPPKVQVAETARAQELLEELHGGKENSWKGTECCCDDCDEPTCSWMPYD